MAIFHGSALFLTGLVIVINLCIGTDLIWAVDIPASFSRNSFPDNFVFGAAASAYQLEGAAAEDGRGPSIWDTFTHQHPEKIVDRSTGDVAIDFYHRYKEDIDMLKQIGMDAYRFSISWSRVLPRGKISGVNQKGIDFYNNVINELISKGIEPYVTLFHWDVPQTLEDEYGGFLHANIVNDFRDYADLCFKEFGDRVKYWITLNEPWTFSIAGYEYGIHAPGGCSQFKENCITDDDTATAPYNVTHNQLLAHAAAVKVYKEKYQMSQMGKIGITLLCLWYVPKTPSDADLNAANRLLDFHTGWFMYPITYGDYPPVMKSYVGSRLPNFTEEQSEMLKGSMDFVGVNYYTTFYASDSLSVNALKRSYTSDSRAEISAYKGGIPICEPTVPVSFIFLCPSGIRDLVLYIKKNYNDPAIYITENGMGDKDDGTVPLQEALKDNQRTKYYKEHLWYLQKSIEDGASVKGHFAWSMFDNFEWGSGYTSRFGLNYVDYKDGLKRYPKQSAIWYKKFLDKAAN